MHPLAPRDLAGHGLATSDGQHAFDGSGARWIPTVGEPPSEGASRQRDRGGGDHEGIGRVDRIRQFVEEYVVVAQEVCGPLDQHRNVTVEDVLDQGQQFVTNSVASESWVVIRLVVNDRKVESLTEPVSVCSAEPDDRLGRSVADASEAGGAAPAKEREQHGLGLVVSGVAGEGLGAGCGAAG